MAVAKRFCQLGIDLNKTSFRTSWYITDQKFQWLGSNCICHIPNLDDLIKGIDLLLSKDGTFIFEEPYLGSMFEKTSYDQIYDEHIYMFSVSSIEKIFNRYDFKLIDAIPQITHGGSMRYIIKRKNNNIIHN